MRPNNKRKELVKARLAQGLTQSTMALRCQVKPLLIFHLENGSIPRPNTLPKLAQGYGIPVKEFVDLLYASTIERTS